MNSQEIRKAFFNFFNAKKHKVIQSAPMVVKNDPSLMFTNAGMNQFKDIFLNNKIAKSKRVCDTQKCLRVSGKHNDLDEVGHDTYHHTMFEMLGNWSFGDYFKKEAISWAYEFLVDELNIDKNRLYATVFEGDESDNLELDIEAKTYWEKFLPEERILNGSKKDNFWEMGETGPCGPCSELHIDLRDEDERKKIKGSELVNKDHPLVIEIWNLVFIQYNRKSDGKLDLLPNKHVDTGMGFERLCMVVQNKKSNYDTDVFQPLIQKLSKISGVKYGDSKKTDIAMRVISDHLRAITFSICDGQLPSNNKAGYVIRRILRRAVRYGYTFLNLNEPTIYKLVDTLVKNMGEAFPELKSQQTLIEKVIAEEEQSFLKTLATGIKILDQIILKTEKENFKVISGKTAFELYDTYGFPLYLTELILDEHKLVVNRKEFNEEMKAQKNRSRSAATVKTEDWIELIPDDVEEFIGYDYLETEIKITRYRKINTKGKDLYHLVFNYTPFYAESGGQVGDIGYIIANGKKTSIIDTQKENELIIHIAKNLPEDPKLKFKAVVNKNKRKATARNHTATHLLHNALREVLGNHVEQKGSLVNSEYLRFDFSHFQKLTDEELNKVETLVNEKIRENISLIEKREIPIKEAEKMGAIALFGEKYGDVVRLIKFDNSIELCGGTHVNATGEIGLIKIVSEGAIAAGIRRIEAVSSNVSEKYINNKISTLNKISSLFNKPANIIQSIESLQNENNSLNKQIEILLQEKTKSIKNDLISKADEINNIKFISGIVDINSPKLIKDMAFQLKNEYNNLFLVLGATINGKANLSIAISDNLSIKNNLNAGKIIREIAKEIKGGGGGQAFYATAGGKNPDGISKAIEKAKEIIS
ncbi:MAG: alanine--tRNA ligase [Bacteroidota bacterium]|nr:alanine--tRNA ligase [Bacteroidota bacterium]